MVYTCTYKSELGEILLAADEIGLTGLWFTGQKYFASTLPDEHISRETPVLSEAKEWLNVYFSGWQILLQIPYGQTTTYGEIARQLADVKRTPGMSAQAVGGAVGHNAISIIIPCHRVVGSNGSLTGYAGGIAL